MLRVGVKVTIKTGKTEERTGIVYGISKKGTVKLQVLSYRKWSKVIRIIESDNKIKMVISEREIQMKKKEGHGPNPQSKIIIILHLMTILFRSLVEVVINRRQK